MFDIIVGWLSCTNRCTFSCIYWAASVIVSWS